MVCGLQKYAGEAVRQRGSSPKLQVFNTALMTAQASYGLKEAKADREYWGHLIESAVEWLRVLSGRKHARVKESPFVATRFVEEQG